MAVETSTKSPTTRKFTTAEFHLMAEAGILKEDERVELIEGEIIQMTAIGARHVSCVIELNHLLVGKLGDIARVSIQNSVRLSLRTEPEPDFAILRRRADRYRNGLATPADILLIIEVSDSSLDYDRDTKVPLYAREGIPETWLVDLEGDALLVYRDPTPEGYKTSRTARRGEPITPVSFPGRQIAVAEILG